MAGPDVMTSLQSSFQQADLADWMTVAAYLLTALVAGLASRQYRSSSHRVGNFWRGVALLMSLFAVNELLDLQTLITIFGRANALSNGWYEHRRVVQAAFVIVLAIAALPTGAFVVIVTRGMPASVRLASVGLGFIGVFIVIRAASFHHMDNLLGRGWLVFNIGAVQELAGIAVVAIAATSALRSHALGQNAASDRGDIPRS